MARIDYANLNDISSELKNELEKRDKLNFYSMLAYGDLVAAGVLRLGEQVIRGSSLTAKLRETLVLLTASVEQSEYEIHQHRRIAKRVGLTDEEINRLLERNHMDNGSVQGEREALLIGFVEQLIQDGDISDDIFGPMIEWLEPRGVMDCVITVGFYMLVSRVLAVFGVDIDDPVEGVETDKWFTKK